MNRFANIERIAAKVDGIIAAKTAPAPVHANHAPNYLGAPRHEPPTTGGAIANA